MICRLSSGILAAESQLKFISRRCAAVSSGCGNASGDRPRKALGCFALPASAQAGENPWYSRVVVVLGRMHGFAVLGIPQKEWAWMCPRHPLLWIMSVVRECYQQEGLPEVG